MNSLHGPDPEINKLHKQKEPLVTVCCGLTESDWALVTDSENYNMTWMQQQVCQCPLQAAPLTTDTTATTWTGHRMSLSSTSTQTKRTTNQRAADTTHLVSSSSSTSSSSVHSEEVLSTPEWKLRPHSSSSWLDREKDRERQVDRQRERDRWTERDGFLFPPTLCSSSSVVVSVL